MTYRILIVDEENKLRGAIEVPSKKSLDEIERLAKRRGWKVTP